MVFGSSIGRVEFTLEGDIIVVASPTFIIMNGKNIEYTGDIIHIPNVLRF